MDPHKTQQKFNWWYVVNLCCVTFGNIFHVISRLVAPINNLNSEQQVSFSQNKLTRGMGANNVSTNPNINITSQVPVQH